MSNRLSGLSTVASRYQAMLSDIWGVVHNGIRHSERAVEALTRFRAEHGPVVLITNAPRPHGPIREQLKQLNVPDECFDDLVTSGDVSRNVIIETGKKKLFHIGPDRDLPLYQGLDVELVGEAEAEVICCTGLVDDGTETPDDYDQMLKNLAKRDLPFICANPDKVVEKGDKLLFCAGALADRFEAYGGETLLVGKPFAPIYEAAIAALNKAKGSELDRDTILTIGDGLPTDIRGAHYQKLDAIFVTAGIHAHEFGLVDDPDHDSVNHSLDHEDVETIGYMPRLVW